jgi:hypothetical protein
MHTADEHLGIATSLAGIVRVDLCRDLFKATDHQLFDAIEPLQERCGPSAMLDN